MTMLGIAMVGVLLIGCDTKKYDPDKPSENKELTPEESKEKLAGVAQEFVGAFNPEDQREAILAAKELTQKFDDYNADALNEHFGIGSEAVAQLPRYAVAVAEGRRSPLALETIIISLEKFSVVFEADEATRTWVNKGKADDGSITLRCVSGNGKKIEAKLWGEGKNTTYTVDEDDVNVSIVVPKKVLFTLVMDQTELIRVELEQDIDLSNHVTLSVQANVANLSWTADTKLTLNSASAASALKKGKETLYSIGIDLPKCKLIGKEDNQTYEEWLMEYGRRYEELIGQIGQADAILNVMGEVQAKLKVKNVGQFYNDIQDFAENAGSSEKENCDKFCKLINESQDNGIYYNNNIKQAELRLQTRVIEYSGGAYYTPEAVIYFPADGTTYSIEEYFTRAPFTEMVQSFYGLIQTYSNYYGELFAE